MGILPACGLEGRAPITGLWSARMICGCTTPRWTMRTEAEGQSRERVKRRPRGKTINTKLTKIAKDTKKKAIFALRAMR